MGTNGESAAGSGCLPLAAKTAPRQSGVYLMKDADGRVIYVGKAKNIRQRLRSYVSQSDSRAAIPFLVTNVATVEFIITNTEKEALILEDNLIKLHRPRYNVFFRDDRSYYSISVNTQHRFPAAKLTRSGTINAKDKNFGPFPSSAAAKTTLQFLQALFQLRSCKDAEFIRRQRPCVEYQIKRCCAPCTGLASQAQYAERVANLLTFLGGGHTKLLQKLVRQMASASRNLNFERAQLLRDQIASIKNTLEKQAVAVGNCRDIDAFGLFRREGGPSACVMFIRSGKLIGKKNLNLRETIAPDGELMSAIVRMYYRHCAIIPDVVVVSHEMEDAETVGEGLSEKKQSLVRVFCPRTGKMAPLKAMALKNAEYSWEAQRSEDNLRETALQKLAARLSLPFTPRHIECFDISNISGTQATGAKVAFIGGVADKSRYRRYRIKTVVGADDYSMMREVLLRRFGSSKEPLPDLLVVDGGKGHLSVALAAIADCGLTGLAVVALAKERRGEDKQERVFLPQRANSAPLPEDAPESLLLRRIRDEAHRFALGYHRHLRDSDLLKGGIS